ncbi:hypothetical protein E4U15_007086 [Claviceps sp. LM218 group G6]|nr:hypothetical protein E4U15_007086 [Claviceps sp. LM218 group G6]
MVPFARDRSSGDVWDVWQGRAYSRAAGCELDSLISFRESELTLHQEMPSKCRFRQIMTSNDADSGDAGYLSDCRSAFCGRASHMLLVPKRSLSRPSDAFRDEVEREGMPRLIYPKQMKEEAAQFHVDGS